MKTAKDYLEEANAVVKKIDVADAIEKHKAGSTIFIDVRDSSDIAKTGTISGALNGLSTLGGLPVALFLLITSMQPIFIRGSLAALFFITDTYAFSLSYFGGIVDMTTVYRSVPLIIILPLGVFIGNKFFVKSREETYRKVVFYFLITISVIGILRILYNF